MPGRGRESCTYDSLDRVITSSDPLQRSRGQYIAYEYDALGRETSRFLMNDIASSDVLLVDSRYDSYSDSEMPVADSVYVQGTALTYPKGMKTVEYVAVIDGTVQSQDDVSYLVRHFWYDSSERVVQRLESFPDGSTLRTSFSYGLQGNILKTMQTRTRGLEQEWMVTTYRYDNRCRPIALIRSFSECDNLDTVIYEYDELGRAATKSCGGKIEEHQDFDIRGWTEGIRSSRGAASLFEETLRYASPTRYLSEGTHNGNISEISFSHLGLTPETMSYFYDGLNRLSDSQHYTGDASSTDNCYCEGNIVYDRNGNITGLDRRQQTSENLSMSYDGNRLLSLSGISETYSYDANGNLAYDALQGLEYSNNFLNLPCDVFAGGTMVLHYSYLADGTKYAATDANGNGLRYIGPFVYKVSGGNEDGLEDDIGTSRLESVAWDEGRIAYDSVSDSYFDLWFTRDHLGNVRQVVDLSRSAYASASDVILEKNDYLPFGTKVSNASLFTSNNRYRLGGKEEQNFGNFTSSLIDFGARHYDPITCRWTAIDPMAEKYYGMSPYGYCGNSPVSFMDKDGRDYKISERRRTITISQTLYYPKYDRNPTDKHISKKAAESAARFWNNQKSLRWNGKRIIFKIKPQAADDFFTRKLNGESAKMLASTAEVEKYQNKKYGDTSAIIVTGHASLKGESYVREDTVNGTTPAHEEGHNLGMKDILNGGKGLMSQFNNEETRTTTITTENIKQMMTSPKGHLDLMSKIMSWLSK